MERLGRDNLRELIVFIHDHGIECDLEETGVLTVADQAHQIAEFRDWVAEANTRGDPLVFLDRAAVQAEVHSPIWEAGVRPGRRELDRADRNEGRRGLLLGALDVVGIGFDS